MSTSSVLSRLVAGPLARPGGPEPRREEPALAAPPLMPAPVARPVVGAVSAEEGAGMLLRPQRSQPEGTDAAPAPSAESVVRPRPQPEEPPVAPAARPAPTSALATPPREAPLVQPVANERPVAPVSRPLPVAQPQRGLAERLAAPPVVTRARPRERDEERMPMRGPLQATPSVEARPSRIATPPLAVPRALEAPRPPASQRGETQPERSTAALASHRDETRPERSTATPAPRSSVSTRGSGARDDAPRVAVPSAPRVVDVPRPGPGGDAPRPRPERATEPTKATDREDRNASRDAVRPASREQKEERASLTPKPEASRERSSVILPSSVQRASEPRAPGAAAPVVPSPRAGVESKRTAAQGPQPRPGVPGGRAAAPARPSERSAAAGAERSRQGRAAVSIAIGTLEIRERTAPTAQPLPAVSPRSHEIDAGLTLGLSPGRW